MTKDKIASCIEILRIKIDKIDQNILKLINTRLKLVVKIGAMKKGKNFNIIDNIREKEIITSLNYLNKGLLEPDDIDIIFSNIISISRRIQIESFRTYSDHDN